MRSASMIGGALLGLAMGVTSAPALAQSELDEQFTLATLPAINTPRGGSAGVIIEIVRNSIVMDRVPIGLRVDENGNAVERLCGPIMISDGRASMLIEKTSGLVFWTIDTLFSPCPNPPEDAATYKIDITEVTR